MNGNLIKSLGENGIWLKYEYDAANRLWLVKRDSDGVMLQRFGYGATNARFQSLDNATGQWTLYAATGGTVLSEYTEFTANVPTWTKSYTYLGDSQLATITPVSGSENVEFNHPDRLGTKTVTNQSTGSSSEQAHLPFGTALNAETSPPLTTTNKRFTSYDRSAKTGLDYAMNRTYDSKLGRFTQVDPIGMLAATPMEPQTLNMYSYCGNDPINYTDPSGLFIGSFFRWLGRVLLGLSRSRVARRIAIKFVVNFALSGGNFGVAIRSVIPDILQSTGIFPDPRSTVPWYPGSRLPISLGTSTLSKYIIVNYSDIIVDGGELAVVNVQISWFDNIVGIADTLIDIYWDFQIGAFDAVTFGYTSSTINSIKPNTIDTSSTAHTIGEYCGIAASFAIPGGAAVKGFKKGVEITLKGGKFRIAPFGNRMGHPTGRFPHYHRQRLKPNGKVKYDQGMRRHRPWDKRPTDKCFRDRF